MLWNALSNVERRQSIMIAETHPIISTNPYKNLVLQLYPVKSRDNYLNAAKVYADSA